MAKQAKPKKVKKTKSGITWAVYIARKDASVTVHTLLIPGTQNMSDSAVACRYAAKEFQVKEDKVLCLPAFKADRR